MEFLPAIQAIEPAGHEMPASLLFEQPALAHRDARRLGREVMRISDHPHESARLVTINSRFVAWKEAWLPNDEVFIKFGETADVDVIVETTISLGIFPVA